MNITRQIETNLLQWKNSSLHKPLILQGARQVGKTWALKHFGEKHFINVAYFNFDSKPELSQFFRTTKDPHRIIQQLALVNGKPILPNETLIILDEIQECNEALNSLKYFYEETPEYFIVCAGSLLGVAMSRGASFPVGKVDFLKLYPLTFIEFLSVADANLFEYLHSIANFDAIPDYFYNQLVEKLKMYFICGGMPEATSTFLENIDVEKTQTILQNILNAYSLDFSKYVNNSDIPKINYIWNSLPSQLARENKKFLYQTIKPGARAREYETSLQWLIDAGLIHRLFACKKPNLPISAYDDLTSFKIYMTDVALLRRLSKLSPIAVSEGDRLFVEFKGALTENFILNSLLTQFETMPRYWKSDSIAEVDFLIQFKNSIFPAEVKSDTNIRSKSLTFYRKEFLPELSIRFSLKNLKKEDGLINIPLFLVDFTEKFCNILNNQ